MPVTSLHQYHTVFDLVNCFLYFSVSKLAYNLKNTGQIFLQFFRVSVGCHQTSYLFISIQVDKTHQHNFTIELINKKWDGNRTKRKLMSYIWITKVCYLNNSGHIWPWPLNLRAKIDGITPAFVFSRTYCLVFLAQLRFSYKLVKMLSVWMCVWMLTRVEQIVTAAHRDLYSCICRPTNQTWSHAKPWSHAKNQASLSDLLYW